MQTNVANQNNTQVAGATRADSPNYRLETPSPISAQRAAYLVGRGIDHDIAAIDLEMVKMKLGEPKEGVGWNAAQCEDAEVEYKRYLMLCRKFPHPQYSIVPNKVMDTIWHYHILDTRAYCRDSENLFGGYFHHFPYFGLRGGDDEKQLKAAFEKTKLRYEKTFGEPMVRASVDASKCWHDCQGRCHNACKN